MVFCLQLKSTIFQVECVPLASVPFIHNSKWHQELLFARSTENDTKGHSVDSRG